MNTIIINKFILNIELIKESLWLFAQNFLSKQNII